MNGDGVGAGRIDFDERGTGPTILFVPGSCSTGAAWRPVIAALGEGFRCATTSLLGYGGTAERRTADDAGIDHEVDAVEEGVRRAGGAVHLVGHSFGGLVAVATALRFGPRLKSLTVIEAPAAELLAERGEREHYATFRRMTDSYFDAFARGEPGAIARMIDFYGGAGSFAAWPAKLSAYANETTAVNMLDWRSAYGFPLSAALLGSIAIPTLVACGGRSPAAVQRANALLADGIREARHVTFEGAAHFLIATHADELAAEIAQHVRRAEAIL